MLEVKTTHTLIGTEAVKWQWRKKAFDKRDDGAKRRLKTSSWYSLGDTGDGDIWLAWQCPVYLDDGREVFPANTEPCTDKEIKTLDESLARRTGRPLEEDKDNGGKKEDMENGTKTELHRTTTPHDNATASTRVPF